MHAETCLGVCLYIYIYIYIYTWDLDCGGGDDEVYRGASAGVTWVLNSRRELVREDIAAILRRDEGNEGACAHHAVAMARVNAPAHPAWCPGCSTWEHHIHAVIAAMVGPCQSRALHLQIHAVAQVVAHLIEHKDCAAISRRLRPRRARARADEVQLQNPGKDEEATKHLNRQGIMSVRKQRARGSTLFFCFSIIISSSSSIIIIKGNAAQKYTYPDLSLKFSTLWLWIMIISTLFMLLLCSKSLEVEHFGFNKTQRQRQRQGQRELWLKKTLISADASQWG